MEREREKEDGRLGDPSRLGIKTPDETQAQGWGPNCKQDRSHNPALTLGKVNYPIKS